MVTALKKEGIRLGTWEQCSEGIELTLAGKNYVEQVLGYENIDICLYQKLIQSEVSRAAYVNILCEKYGVAFDKRPSADVTLDQAQCSTAPSMAPVRCFTQLVTYDAYNMADIFLTQPLQLVAGSLAGSKWYSEDLYNRAASTDKNLHIVEGANHMQMYDIPKYVDEAVSVLAPFFKKNI